MEVRAVLMRQQAPIDFTAPAWLAPALSSADDRKRALKVAFDRQAVPQAERTAAAMSSERSRKAGS